MADEALAFLHTDLALYIDTRNFQVAGVSVLVPPNTTIDEYVPNNLTFDTDRSAPRPCVPCGPVTS